jgi:hypothetical protein
MSRRLILRMWLFRLGRGYERALKLATAAGFGGLVITGALHSLAPDLGQDWQMLFLGVSLILAGTGHALLGEGASLASYAAGESEEMPAITRLASGLLASAGGLLIAAIGLVQIMG